MKNKTISGILFTILFAVQAFTLIYVLQSAAVTSIPISIFFDLAALVVFGLAGANLIAGKGIDTTKSAVLAAMYVFVSLLNYNMQLTIVTSALATISEAFASSMTLAIVIMVVRVVLLAFAIWFAGMKETAPAEKVETPEQEAVEETVEAAEQVADTAATETEVTSADVK